MNTEKEMWLKSLDQQQKLIFFVTLSHGITVAMRMIINLEDQEWRQRINALNEAQHVVCGHLIRMSSGGQEDHWLPIMIKAFSLSEDIVIKQQLEQAWIYAKEAVNQAKERGKSGS
jgi:hypothetical protein